MEPQYNPALPSKKAVFRRDTLVSGPGSTTRPLMLRAPALDSRVAHSPTVINRRCIVSWLVASCSRCDAPVKCDFPESFRGEGFGEGAP
jgi:hypothetical protein